MKSFFLVLIFTISSTFVNAQINLEKRKRFDKDKGFRNVELGLHISKFNDLIELGEKKFGGVWYSKKGDNLEIGQIKAEFIDYLFMNDTLNIIMIYFIKCEDVQKFNNYLTDLYGKPDITELSCKFCYSWFNDFYDISSEYYDKYVTFRLNSYSDKAK